MGLKDLVEGAGVGILKEGAGVGRLGKVAVGRDSLAPTSSSTHCCIGPTLLAPMREGVRWKSLGDFGRRGVRAGVRGTDGPVLVGVEGGPYRKEVVFV